MHVAVLIDTYTVSFSLIYATGHAPEYKIFFNTDCNNSYVLKHVMRLDKELVWMGLLNTQVYAGNYL